MSTLNVPGAQLNYEVSGEGPLLVLIPGSNGGGDIFGQVAQSLKDRYQVVTYDRRGFSKSELDGTQDYDHRLQTDAEDVRRLIEHLSNKPATIFGTDSGAVVALEVLTLYADQVHTVVAHEPTAVKLLPDAAKWLALFVEVYDTYRQSGVPRAMHQYASGILSPDHRLLMPYIRDQTGEHGWANAAYWMEHELRQYASIEFDLKVLASHKIQLVVAGGIESQSQLSYQPSIVLAQTLSLDIVNLPGGHLGYLSHPDDFAKELTSVLKN